MPRLPIEAVVEGALLDRIQQQPSFSAHALVHTDLGRRVPVLRNDSRSSHIKHQRRPAFLLNPAVHNDQNMLLKVGTYSRCAIDSGANSNANRRIVRQTMPDGATTLSGDRWTVWLRHHQQVAGVYPYTEDARPVLLDGRMHMVFARKGNNFGMVRMYLAALEPVYREVHLNYSNAYNTEKNWMPWEYEGQLHVSYTLCPHKVLRCNATDGQCALAHETKLDSCSRDLRGSSQWVAVGNDAMVGVAHVTRHMGGSERHRQNLSIDLRYEHAFLQASATPPFELRYFSAPFMFPRLYNTDVDFVQFCAGLAIGDNTSELTYGIGDCGAFSVSMPKHMLLHFANVSGPRSGPTSSS